MQKKQKDSISRHPDAFVHKSAYVDEGVTLGAGTKIWHFAHILKGSTLGCNVVVGQNVMIGPNVTVGDGSKIQNNVSLYEGVEIEANVFCGPSCVFTNVINPRAAVERKAEFKRTLVKRGSTIGANATIICGIVIGEYAFVGAGSVVTRDVQPHALVVGNPAHRVGWISRSGEKLDNNLICPRTGERYRETEPGKLSIMG